MGLINAILNRKSIEVSQFLRGNYILIFAFVFFTSWMYQIRALGNINVYALKDFFLLFFVVVTAFLIKWRDVKLDAFLISCVLWVVLTLFSWAIHQGAAFPYLRRVFQAAFFFLFVTYLRLNPSKNPCLQSNLDRWFPSTLVFIASWIFIGMYWLDWLTEDMKHGFGNSSGGFSIWLMQLTAFFLIAKLTRKEGVVSELLVCIMLITPIFAIQVMTGGRTGAIGSLILVCFFAFRWGGIKAVIISVLWLYIVAALVANYTPQIVMSHHINVFRNVEPYAIGSRFPFMDWLDRLLSYRLSLLITAFGALDLSDFWAGVGLGNFLGWAPEYPALGKLEVHNVLLKVLGEVGVFGFFLAFIICTLPAFVKPKNVEQKNSIFVLFAYFAVSLVHPDLMLTAVNLSFVYLCSFAFLLTNFQLSSNVELVKDKCQNRF